MSLYAPHSMHQAYGSQSAAAAYMQSSSFYNSPAYGMLQQGYHNAAAGMYRQLCVCVCACVCARASACLFLCLCVCACAFLCVCARAHARVINASQCCPHCFCSSIKWAWLLSCLWKETVLQWQNVLYAFRSFLCSLRLFCVDISSIL